jgi:hypothetical protein
MTPEQIGYLLGSVFVYTLVYLLVAGLWLMIAKRAPLFRKLGGVSRYVVATGLVCLCALALFGGEHGYPVIAALIALALIWRDYRRGERTEIAKGHSTKDGVGNQALARPESLGTPASKKSSFWWPAVETRENASEAAKGGGIAFGFVTLGYLIAAGFVVIGIKSPMQPSAATDPALMLTVDLIIAAIAAYLSWRTYRKPTLTLCVVAITWVAIEFVGKSLSLGLVGNIIGAYWGNILAAVTGIAGLRGAWAVRRFQRDSIQRGLPNS